MPPLPLSTPAAWLPKRTPTTLLAIGMVMVLGVLLATLSPEWASALILLHWLIAFLLAALVCFIRHPLELSALPAFFILLVFYRIALSIAVARLILTPGLPDPKTKAGIVIAWLGETMAGSQPVIGLIVYALLALIQFLVITRGTTRIAEVAARFQLDALPGKQAAIEADLVSKSIGVAQAKQERQAIRHEADFYGAMDGISRFIRGDALAGNGIVLINWMGGIAAGLHDGMDALQVLRIYTVLAVGAGLAHLVPNLVTSFAAGLVVSRSKEKDSPSMEPSTSPGLSPLLFLIVGLLILTCTMALLPPMAGAFVMAILVFTGIWLAVKRQ